MKSITFQLLLFSCLLFTSCIKEFSNNCITGTGTVEKRTIELETITKIDLGMEADLIIQEGPQFIEIEAPTDIIDRIIDQSEVGSERWIIELNDCYDGQKITIWATLPKFVALDISGSGNISTSDTLQNVESLNLEIDGSGDIDVQITDAEKLDLEIKGSGNIDVVALDVLIHSYHIQGSGDIKTLFNIGETCRMEIEGSGNIETSGTIKSQTIEIKGQGDILALDLCSQTCDIDSKGSGNCTIKVMDRLTINIEGSGDICYRGNPSISSKVAGSGSIKDCN